MRALLLVSVIAFISPSIHKELGELALKDSAFGKVQSRPTVTVNVIVYGVPAMRVKCTQEFPHLISPHPCGTGIISFVFI